MDPNRVRCVSGEMQTSFVKYIDNADGTIKDKQTGLTWQKCSVGQTNDATCSMLASFPDWATALTTCSGLPLAGKTWRLPSLKELKTIIDTNLATPPTIDTAIFPSTELNGYWSSTTYAPVTGSAWVVAFNGGNATDTAKIGAVRVRCVSGP